MFAVILSFEFIALFGLLSIGALVLWFSEKKSAAIAVGIGEILLLTAITIPGIRPARPMAQRNTCVANLKFLTELKKRWAEEHNRSLSDAPTEADLVGYIKSKVMPTCPIDGARYVLGTMEEKPRCPHETSHKHFSNN